MGRMQRTKGQVGERELCKLLDAEFADLLPEPLSRNLDQVREGGADIMGIPGIALEVKRHESLAVNVWWIQCVQQAMDCGRFPVLAYRQNRKPWAYCLPASLIVDESWSYITVTQDVFYRWLRKRLAPDV